MRRLGLILAVVGAPACSASVGDPNEPDPVDDANPGGGGAAEYVRFRGTLAATPSMAFGGDPYCNYSVVLRDVEIEAVLRKADELVAMSIEDTMSEAIVGTCPYTAEPPSRQQFTYDSGRSAPLNAQGQVEPMLMGVASNRPMTAVTSLVSVRGDGGLQATGRWERIDQGPPLKWVISTAAVVMPRATCVPGAGVCVGGSKGTLYMCEDGMMMSVVRICATGCAASKMACN